MTEEERPEIDTPKGKGWSNKDVTLLLLNDVHRRFDGVDKAVSEVREEQRALASTVATKPDITEIHKRIDGVEARVEPLEEASAAQRIIDQNRAKFRSAVIKTVGLVTSLAIIGGFVWSILVAVH